MAGLRNINGDCLANLLLEAKEEHSKGHEPDAFLQSGMAPRGVSVASKERPNWLLTLSEAAPPGRNVGTF